MPRWCACTDEVFPDLLHQIMGQQIILGLSQYRVYGPGGCSFVGIPLMGYRTQATKRKNGKTGLYLAMDDDERGVVISYSWMAMSRIEMIVMTVVPGPLHILPYPYHSHPLRRKRGNLMDSELRTTVKSVSANIQQAILTGVHPIGRPTGIYRETIAGANAWRLSWTSMSAYTLGIAR